jgi:hypothetical protein
MDYEFSDIFTEAGQLRRKQRRQQLAQQQHIMVPVRRYLSPWERSLYRDPMANLPLYYVAKVAARMALTARTVGANIRQRIETDVLEDCYASRQQFF